MYHHYLRFTLLLLLGFILSSDLFAQESSNRRRRRNLTPAQRAARLDKMMARLKDSLDLNNEQVSKIKELNLQMTKKRRASRQKYADDRQMMREEMTDLRIKYQKGVKKVLNKTQWKKFKKMEAARRKRRMERRRKQRNNGG